MTFLYYCFVLFFQLEGGCAGNRRVLVWEKCRKSAFQKLVQEPLQETSKFCLSKFKGQKTFYVSLVVVWGEGKEENRFSQFATFQISPVALSRCSSSCPGSNMSSTCFTFQRRHESFSLSLEKSKIYYICMTQAAFQAMSIPFFFC